MRLEALCRFTPSSTYTWQLQWDGPEKTIRGTLTGTVLGKHHQVTITFEDNACLVFDKNNPTWALYPHRLALLPQEKWLLPLRENPGLNVHLLLMPFLGWPIQSCEKTAKFGRRALKIICSQGGVEACIYLDRNFNSLLYVALCTRETTTPLAFFRLKHFKKFGQQWSLRRAEFGCGQHKTQLTVLSVNGQR